MREEWRLFAALTIPEEAHERIATAITTLRARGYRAKWVDPATSHLTVKFFGNVPVTRIPALIAALRTSVQGVTPFVLHLAGAGAFPHPERPRVLWFGIGGDLATLGRLVKRVEASAGAFAETNETRPFHPHITLGRVRPEDLPSLRGISRELERLGRLPALEWTVDRLVLYRSELFRAGPRYSVIEELPLG